MKRYFNTEGNCRPGIHYMVNLDDRLQEIRQFYVERGKYFAINRGRQYGKTTTLMELAEYLRKDYIVLFVDFQKIGTEEFQDIPLFVRAFSKMLLEELDKINIKDKNNLQALFARFAERRDSSLRELFSNLSALCKNAGRPMVLMIDEVDAASNYLVFIDFLAMLRGYYLDRENSPIFQSVILASVYDIKNLKLKLRPDEEHKYNSPWNIAAEFDMNMSFSSSQIAVMLKEYAEDQQIDMDTNAAAEEIFCYTSGYPYLVSAICKILDEKLPEMAEFADQQHIWSREGISYAVRLLLQKKIPLFESMTRQFSEYPDIKQMLNAILFQGKRVTYNLYNPVINLAEMFGYIVNKKGSIQVANRIFEMLMYNFFLSEEEMTNAIYNEAQSGINQFVKNNRLNMDLVLEKFVMHFSDIYGENDEKFVEDYGRKFFLLYLKPIINGTGNYYVEAQTRDASRTDVIVDYLGEQFVVELKIWRGNEYNKRGEEQLADYLDYYHKEKGYMLSFNFNKKKEPGMKEIQIGRKTIVEAVV